MSCKEGTRGKVVSLNTVTQRSPTRRCEFMGEERRLQGAFRPKKGISATLVNYLVLKFSLISSAIYNFTKVFDNLIDTVDGFIYSLNISVFLPQLIAYHKTKLTNISLRV